MSAKQTYSLSVRQLLIIGGFSALLTGGIMAAAFAGGFRFPGSSKAPVVFAEETPAGISDPNSVTDEQNNIEVYRTISPGVAYITTSSRVQNFFGEQFEQESGNGSGSVIDGEGHILTNFHVVENASKLTVSFGNDKVYEAKVIGGDPDTDLAVIKIDAPKDTLTIVPLGDSDKLMVGQKVLAIGNPFGLDRTLTTGVISGLQRPIRARNGRPIDAAIQTDASINPGNSGGPLLDKYGKMIGINSQILSQSGGSVGVGFAIPVSIAKRIVPQLINAGFVERPKLAANLRSVKELIAQGYRLPTEHGLLIARVIPGGSASRAGLKGISSNGSGDVIGDIILSVDGIKMNDLDDLYRLLDKKKVGDTLSTEIFRAGKTESVSVKLIQTPQQTR
jgi:putative serine protease PepD